MFRQINIWETKTTLQQLTGSSDRPVNYLPQTTHTNPMSKGMQVLSTALQAGTTNYFMY